MSNILEKLLGKKVENVDPQSLEGYGKKVLVVEDNPPLLKLICEVHLKPRGYTVISKYNGRDAWLELERGFTPDIIITDLMMPIMNGEELVKKIKSSKNQRIKDIPIIMLTGKDRDEDVFKGWQSGCFAYLTKPYNPHELFTFMKQAFRPVEDFEGETVYDL